MHTMRRLAATLLVLAALSAAAVDSDPTAQAKVAAKSWLNLTDSGKYGQSWDEASSFFKASISKAVWEQAVSSVRSPLGALKARKVISATFTRTLPGAPEGEYVVIQYASEFANKSGAIETVTPMRDKDGIWRVSGYFIK